MTPPESTVRFIPEKLTLLLVLLVNKVVANSAAVPPLIVVVLLSALKARSTSPLATVLTPLIALFRSVTSMVVPPVIVTPLAVRSAKDVLVNCALSWAQSLMWLKQKQ